MNEDTLRKLQLLQFDILCQVDSVCRKNNLEYVLVGGTLLGAKRHNGFIPWDDDLDIAMPREDYEKFKEVAKKEFDDSLYLKHFGVDDNYYLPYGKVCKKGTTYISEMDSDYVGNVEIFIDVFPLDNAKKQMSLGQKIQSILVKGLKAVIIRKKKLKVKTTSVQVKVLQVVFAPFSAKQLMKFQDKIMTMNKKTESEYYVNNGSNYSYVKQTMPKNIFHPLTEINFEGKMFYAPRDTEYWLERIYGKNYMQLPPVEKRVTHNIVKLDLGDNN